jgi:hypothetical protein
MAQALRVQGKDIQSFGAMLRGRIDSSMAVDKLNGAIAGEPITLTQFHAIRLAIDKCLPSLAAMVLDVVDHRPQSVHDLNARLLMSGLDPLDITSEKAIAREDDSEGGHPEVEDA